MVESTVNGQVPALPDVAKEAGEECLRLLDKHKFGVQGAVWIYSSILGEWRFYVVTSLVEIDGPLATYERIERLFGLAFKNKHLLIDDVHLGSPNEDLFLAMADIISAPRRKGRRTHRIGVETITLNNVYIENALIYRLDKAPPKIDAIRNRKAFDRHLRELEAAVG